MAYTKNSYSKTPTIDGGLGLIIRLNVLFNKADRSALAGDFDEWDNILDRIFCNLCYRQPMEISINENNQVTKLALNEEDEIVHKEFLKRIRAVKRMRMTAVMKKDRKALEEAKQAQYNLLMMKDIWLRKTMSNLGLYLKEMDFNPATAMFGGM